MPNPVVYGAWAENTARCQHRSHLYSLPPMGVGTAAVESLTGYIARLAAAHAVETGTLVNHELLQRVPYTRGLLTGRAPSKLPAYSFYLDAHSLNGTGDRSRLWVSLVEQMTRIDRLDLLTALPWAKTISCVHLLRTQRAWCPFCYGVRRDTGPSVHERLLWTFQVVTVCPDHCCPLETICRSCGRTQYVLSSKSRPGYCSRCQCWLGREPEAVGGDFADPIRIAEMVGQMLTASPGLPAGFGLSPFQENVRNLRYNRQSGGILGSNARAWVNAGSAPRMDSLVALSLGHQVSMLHLLTEKILVAPRVAEPRHSRYAHFRAADVAVEEALHRALRDKLPQSLSDIAKDLGYRTICPLQMRYHDLCDQVINKRRSALKDAPPPLKTPLPRELIERALVEAISQDAPISLESLAATIGLRNKRRLYKGFHDLSTALVAKNRRFRQQRLESIKSALRSALAETPVPTVTDVARRLGFKVVTPLTRRFPDLSSALIRRRREAVAH